MIVSSRVVALFRFVALLVACLVTVSALSVDPAWSAPTKKARSQKARASKAPVKKSSFSKPAVAAPAKPTGPAFSLHKLGEGAPAVLIVGGIQGDEPGGFSAASLLATHYTVTAGAVWVVPNLGFGSILERSRGVNGDMNRKFAELPKNDPDYTTVRRMQELIRTPGLQLVLNLHDGSGFYRPTRVSAERNPQRWGQCVIIDKSAIEHAHGDLEQRGEDVLREVNRTLLTPDHALYLKNTLTDMGNVEMEKSLTWFAVRNNVPAFGVEASKALTTEVRAYYHLQLIEAFLTQAGVAFSRPFPLTPKAVGQALSTDLNIAFANNRIALPLENIRTRLSGSLPLPKNAATNYTASKPILAVSAKGRDVALHYGNRVLTRFNADWMDMDTSLDGMTLLIDGKEVPITFGQIADVATTFTVKGQNGYRVNAIGATKGGDESNIAFKRSDFQDYYSVDPEGYVFRVEVYKDKAFSGMFLVRYAGASKKPAVVLPAVAGRETRFGM